MNKSAFDALPEAHQQALMTAAANAEERGWKIAREEAKKAVETLGENGMNVVEPSDSLLAEFNDIGDTMTQEWLDEAGEQGQTIVDRYNSM